jgi:hypothetical protein
MKEAIKLEILEPLFGIVKLEQNSNIPKWVANEYFYSITKTAAEISVVCLQRNIPDNKICEKDWKVIKIAGSLDFSMVGIISKLSTVLADGGISIFVISTYDTDYILIKKRDIENTIELLKEAGYNLL